MRTELRPHQQRAMDMLRSSLASGKRRPMLQAPTGAGKTRLSAEIVHGALAKGKRVCFTAPAISLIDQTVQAFFEQDIRDVGVMQADHPMTAPGRPVQVASVQTLERRYRPDVDLVIVDEAHRDHKVIRDWMASRPDLPFIGLSATPWTKGLGKHYDDLLVAATTAELIDAGYLSDFRVYAPSHPDLSGVKTVAGDYHEGQLGTAMSDEGLVADTVATWLDKAEGRPTLVFAVNRAHARHLVQRFERAGVATAYVDADTPGVERTQIGRRLEAGDVQVVVNIGCLTTGVDWDVRCIQLCRPTKSEMLHVQIIGRGLRTAPGKADCLILDHADNHARLGFVTDIHHDKLDDGSEKGAHKPRDRKEPLPKECGKCGVLKPVRARVCPACGHEAAPPVEGVEEQDGELQEVRGVKKAKASMDDKAAWYQGLLWIACERGYKEGWAANKYRSKFGVWPRAIERQPRRPADEVRRWVKAEQIRFAKRREKEARHAA